MHEQCLQKYLSQFRFDKRNSLDGCGGGGSGGDSGGDSGCGGDGGCG